MKKFDYVISTVYTYANVQRKHQKLLSLSSRIITIKIRPIYKNCIFKLDFWKNICEENNFPIH